MSELKKAYTLLRENSLEKFIKPYIFDQLELLSYPKSTDILKDIEIIDTVLSNTLYHPAITSFLKTILELASRNTSTILRILLFGSSLSKNFTKQSDIDICIIVENKYNIPIELNLALMKLEYNCNYKVDLILTDTEEYAKNTTGVFRVIKEKGLEVYKNER